MGDAAGPAGAGLQVAQIGLGFLGSQREAKSAKLRAREAERQAKYHKLRGKQISAERMTELNDTLSTITALRSQRNVGLDSPNAQLVERKTRRRSKDIESAEVLGTLNASAASLSQARGFRRAASAKLLGGYANAAGGFASMLAKG